MLNMILSFHINMKNVHRMMVEPRRLYSLHIFAIYSKSFDCLINCLKIMGRGKKSPKISTRAKEKYNFRPVFTNRTSESALKLCSFASGISCRIIP